MRSLHFRILILLLTLSLLLTACGTPSVGGETTPPAETTEPAPAELVLFGGNVTYNVYRDTYASSAVCDAVRQLSRRIYDLYGSSWSGIVSEDFDVGLDRDSIVDNTAPEILLGSTNRRESREVTATLGKDDYIITAVGNKVVVAGGSDYATVQAIELFAEQYLKDGSTTLVIPADLSIKGEASLRHVSLNREAKYRLMTWNLGCAVGVASDAVDIINEYLPDIVALQECNAKIHKNVIEKLPEFYAVANKYHPGTSTYVYTPIIYNTELFTLRDSGVEWLRDRYTGTNTKSASWAVFEDADGQLFADVNFHGAVCSNSYKGFENFTSAERAAQALTWRVGNARQVLEIIDRIEAQFGKIPVMLNGDCNFKRNTEPYNIIINGGMTDAEFTARLGRVSGYQTYFSYGTGIKNGDSIDHIFGRNAIDFVEHYIVRDTKVTTASDHCPVYVDFGFLTEKVS